MEGVGSQLGRASSRYGPSTTPTVFNDLVRKWTRTWVHVRCNPFSDHKQPPQLPLSLQRPNNDNNNSRLLLFRWTPLSPAAADAHSRDPSKHNYRYTPVAVIEEQGRAAKTVEKEAKTSEANQLTALQTSKNDDLNSDQVLKKETQDAIAGNLELGLCLKGHDSDPESAGQKEDQMKKASSAGFWKLC